MACGASAGLMGALSLATAGARDELDAAWIVFAWWLIAGLIGASLGRRSNITDAISRLLVDARASGSLPLSDPRRTLFNRLWPLLLFTVAASACALLGPQIPGIAAGFAAIGALAWRRQPLAVAAVEGRDGVRFYVERTSLLKPIQLLRTPGFKRDRTVSTNRSGPSERAESLLPSG